MAPRVSVVSEGWTAHRVLSPVLSSRTDRLTRRAARLRSWPRLLSGVYTRQLSGESRRAIFGMIQAMETRLDHVCANATHPRRAVEWYTTVLGFEVESF